MRKRKSERTCNDRLENDALEDNLYEVIPAQALSRSVDQVIGRAAQRTQVIVKSIMTLPPRSAWMAASTIADGG